MKKLVLPKPTLVFIAGGPCTGKTTLLNRLLTHLEGVVLVDKDDISDSMMRTPDSESTGGKYDITWYRLCGERISISSQHYRDFIGKQTYHAMLEIAASNLKFGVSIFLQGNYTAQINEGYFPRVVHPFLEEKEINGYKLILCHADPEVLKRRIRERNDPRDASKLESDESLERYVYSQDFVPERIKELDHLKLDTTKASVRESAGAALHYLLSQP